MSYQEQAEKIDLELKNNFHLLQVVDNEVLS